jgi:hypothetical protein
LGAPDDYDDYIDKLNQLDTWARAITPVLMNSITEVENGLWVKPDPVPVRRLSAIMNADGQRVGLVCSMTLIEI